MSKAQNNPLPQHPQLKAAIDLLEAWIEAQAAYSELPGMSMGIILDQDLIWSRGFGYGDRDKKTPARPDTIYRVASLTKLFTNTAIVQLRDQGALQLDDPVARHLPWFALRNPFPDAPEITIRHLLTHTAGLPREAAFPYWTDFQFPSREQLLESLPDQELVYPPETCFKYSNLGLALAGEIISSTAGLPYGDYIHQHILAPLEMHSTSVVLPAAHKNRLATGYSRYLPGHERRVEPAVDTGALAAAGNLSSTVEDMARFAALQFSSAPVGGRQILKASSLREMHRVHWLFPNWEGGLGLGFMVFRQPQRTLVGHSGQLPGYRTLMLLSPAEKLGLVIMTNATDGNPHFYANQAFQLLGKALGDPSPRPPMPFDPDWHRYAGKYRSLFADIQILVLNERLVLVNPTEIKPEGAMYEMIPTGPHSFRLEGEDGIGPRGEPVFFELGPKGAVSRLKIGENYLLPHSEY